MIRRRTWASPAIGRALAVAIAALPVSAPGSPAVSEGAGGADAASIAAAADRAASYYAGVVSDGGAYAWGYTPDLSMRFGKGGPVGPNTGLARPPGTPSVGAAFLRLHQATGNPRWLKAAQEAAHALAQSQLASGGWGLTIEMDPAARREWCYVADGIVGDACKALKGKDKNRSLLDDNITQSVVRFLLWFEEETGGSDLAVTEAIDRALSKLSKAIYPNGACPLEMPVRDREEGREKGVAKLPDSWSREWVKPGDTGPYYILNDNLQRDCVFVFLVAERRAGDGRYLKVARQIGDFLLRTQLPEPQPGWAQTYNRELEPVWGRPFEPPAVATAETAGAVAALIALHTVTGDDTYKKAAEKAVRWLRDMRRPDNTWVRFHELGSDKPLFIDADNLLTYDDDNLREGYGFTGTFGIPHVLDLADAMAAERPATPIDWWSDPTEGAPDAGVAARARALAADQRPEGGWQVGDVIDTKTFVEAMFVFSRLLLDPAVARVR